MQAYICTKHSYIDPHVSAYIGMHVCIHTPVPAHYMLPCMIAWVQASPQALRNTCPFVIVILNNPLPLSGLQFFLLVRTRRTQILVLAVEQGS